MLKGRPDADLGLIVSDQLFSEATGRCELITPEAYQNLRATNKGMRLKAWVWLPPMLGQTKSA